MKQLQPREASPLWVWLSIVLIGFGALAYFTGYLLIEEIIAFLKRAAIAGSKEAILRASGLPSESNWCQPARPMDLLG